MGTSHSLDDKYTAETGSVFMNGTQALVRLPMAQMRRDRRLGLNTAAFISGYRGSPLGIYDLQLEQAQRHLEQHGITFQPGVNEDLAATAIWGTQQVPLSAQANKDGVVGIWYAKGPGVDRCGDVFKHGNAAGTSAHGGVLCLAGDDHAAKSSTVPHQSDHGFMAAVIPVLYPSSIHEFIDLGLLGIAMSRYAGCWVGYKVISDTVETSAVVQLSDEHRPFIIPEDCDMPEGGLNLRWPDPPLVQDERLQEHKAYAALAFARANGIDQLVVDAKHARFGIIATGKAFEDVRQAMTELGIDQQAIEAIGLRLYKVRMPWPLEPHGVRRFSEGLDEVLIIEERREIIEHQIKQQLFNWRSDVRPRIVGKFDETDKPFLPLSAALSISRVARAIAERVLRLPLEESLKKHIEQRLAYLQKRDTQRALHAAPVQRQAWFCSGCPHNTSTKVPQGSKAMAGIGCHYMVLWMDRDTETFTQMGGEGVPWTSISHYTGESHRFVNIGDGTYFHSGLLAIRASVASGVNITYKVLYNDAVAMTGGQSTGGNLSAERVTWQLHSEGVAPVYLISDQPEQFRPDELAPGIIVEHRDQLDNVQRQLRELSGCNAIVYEQTCAAEKRRRRKRGLLEDPPTRLFINQAVCEGCGDCSVQSNCVSIEPLETAMGRKRRINQSSCNKDYSCVKGFCPSFVTIDGGTLRRRQAQVAGDMASLPLPGLPVLGDTPWNILVTGVGGTGVLTIGAIIGMAAHIDGRASLILDMAGIAQKGGAVLSHVRLAVRPGQVTSPHIVTGAADLLIAADDVVAASSDGIVLCDAERTQAVVNTATAPVAAFIGARDFDFQHKAVADTIAKFVRHREHFHSFSSVAEQLVGDAIATNIMMLGYAWQSGLVPLSINAIEQAIELNGVAVAANHEALDWGRRFAADPAAVSGMIQPPDRQAVLAVLSLQQLIAHRMGHLNDYQDARLAERYQLAVQRVSDKCSELGLDDSLPRVVAQNYAKLLAYKDEYEVARLLSSDAFRQQVDAQFDGEFTVSYNLAPPILSGRAPDGRPRKRKFGPGMLRVLKLLRRGKVLRGTPVDPFAWSAERRSERSWIRRYEADINKVLASLTVNKLDASLAILSLPDAIRGFGPVKAEAMRLAVSQRDALWAEYENPQPVDVTRVAA